ncbi:hypothetical protein [Streptomyces flavofungini]|uniref:hypothetical protein n=1 Tax=Streptomyces flavofungini TaxID=68200 RepID=UPI0025B20254|nr:hypothetical protein [Streptomyces flavofungini]WJV51766.1 hypothetical protein QUY26_39760 [Streptomyces flavofungini]
MNVSAHPEWRRQVQVLVDQGVPESEARRRVKVPVPSKLAIQKHLNLIKGDSRKGELPEGALGPGRPCPWWYEVNTYTFQSAFIDAGRGKTGWARCRESEQAVRWAIRGSRRRAGRGMRAGPITRGPAERVRRFPSGGS